MEIGTVLVETLSGIVIRIVAIKSGLYKIEYLRSGRIAYYSDEDLRAGYQPL